MSNMISTKAHFIKAIDLNTNMEKDLSEFEIKDKPNGFLVFYGIGVSFFFYYDEDEKMLRSSRVASYTLTGNTVTIDTLNSSYVFELLEPVDLAAWYPEN